MPALRAPKSARDRTGRFVNWAGTVSHRPSAWHLPRTEAEIVRLVASSTAARTRLRVIGAGHSFSAIAAPDGDALSLDAMERAVVIDRTRGVVTASAGMRLRELTLALARQGLALPIVGSIQAQTLGGMIATGTHGSSLTHGNLASLVSSLRIVTGSGDVLDIHEGDERLDGARVHLGALGVVTQVTLPVRPSGRLHQSIEHVPIEMLADALPEIAASAEYVKVWWLAHTTEAQVVRYHVTTAPMSRRPSPVTQRWIDERVMHRWVFPGLIRLHHRRPTMTAGINQRLSHVYLGAASQIGPGLLMLNTPMPLRHRETEAAVPITKAPEALKNVFGLFRAGRPAVTFPIEIRFVRGDDIWLSPAQGADTCQIGAYTTDGPDCAPYFDAFWDAMRPFGARPHWGKELDHTVAELRPLYPHYERFIELRETMDPNRVFGGEFLTRVLGR
jgi:FAD/FMN-containing dehydrogenase